MAAEIATVVVGVVLGIGAFVAVSRAPAVQADYRRRRSELEEGA